MILFQMHVYMQIGMLDIIIQEYLQYNLVFDRLHASFYRKCCLATIAKDHTVEFGTTPANVCNVVLNMCQVSCF